MHNSVIEPDHTIYLGNRFKGKKSAVGMIADFLLG